MKVNDYSDASTSGYTVDLSDEMISTGLQFPESGFSDFTSLYVSRSGSAQLISASRYGKRYILKCLKEDFRYNPVYRTALLKEFEIGLALDHPNIRRTIGFEDVAGYGPAIILEYIDGDTLENLLTRNEITPENALIILRQLADALRYIHSKQVVHRDLKPANILVTYSGEVVKLIDFNLSDSETFTVIKVPAGTKSYMAPELLLPDAKANVKTDIYSFGMIVGEIADAVGDSRLARIARECTAYDSAERPNSISAIPLPSEPQKESFLKGFVFASPKMTQLLVVLIALFSLWIALALLLRSPL